MSDQKLIIGYYRLSMEDDSEGESNSIINQRKLVKDYISNIPELVAMPFQGSTTMDILVPVWNVRQLSRFWNLPGRIKCSALW